MHMRLVVQNCVQSSIRLMLCCLDGAGTWRAKMKGYETSSRKAAMLLRLIRKQKQAVEASDLGSTSMAEHHPLEFVHNNADPVTVR